MPKAKSDLKAVWDERWLRYYRVMKPDGETAVQKDRKNVIRMGDDYFAAYIDGKFRINEIDPLFKHILQRTAYFLTPVEFGEKAEQWKRDLVVAHQSHKLSDECLAVFDRYLNALLIEDLLSSDDARSALREWTSRMPGYFESSQYPAITRPGELNDHVRNLLLEFGCTGEDLDVIEKYHALCVAEFDLLKSESPSGIVNPGDYAKALNRVADGLRVSSEKFRKGFAG